MSNRIPRTSIPSDGEDDKKPKKSTKPKPRSGRGSKADSKPVPRPSNVSKAVQDIQDMSEDILGEKPGKKPGRGRPASPHQSGTKCIYFSDKSMLERIELICDGRQGRASTSALIQQLVAGFLMAFDKACHDIDNKELQDGGLISQVDVKLRVRI